MKRLILPIAIVLLALSAYAAYAAYGSTTSRDMVIPKEANNCCLEQTYALLRSLHLRVSVDFLNSPTLHVSSSNPPAVEQMWPAPGAHVIPGEVVTLVVSQSITESRGYLQSDPQYRVPSFVGGSAAAAIGWAKRHNLDWEIPHLPALPWDQSLSPTLWAAYRVEAQEPKPGTVMRQWHRTASGHYSGGWSLTLTVVPR